jgi:hypothetical protein
MKDETLTYSEEAPAAHAGEEPRNDEHTNIDRTSEKRTTNDGKAGTVYQTSLATPFIHHVAGDEDTKECTRLRRSVNVCRGRLWTNLEDARHSTDKLVGIGCQSFSFEVEKAHVHKEGWFTKRYSDHRSYSATVRCDPRRGSGGTYLDNQMQSAPGSQPSR